MIDIEDKLTIFKRKIKDLNVIFLKRTGLNSSIALITIKYGSVYRKDSLYNNNIPDGTAHFLEHRLFDLNGKDLNKMFSELGADSNAFTSNKTTNYYFITTENFFSNLSILLDLTYSHRTFDKKKIEKEKKIIQNEITMHDDDPYTKGYYKLLDSMYWFNPAKIKVIGSLESISKIDHKILKKTHESFYNFNNSFLIICSDIDENDLFDFLSKNLEKYNYNTPKQNKELLFQEPIYPKNRFKREFCRVTRDLLFLGFKFRKTNLSLKEIIMIDLILDVLFGSMSEFSDYIYSQMLIDDTFNYSFNWEENSNSVIMSGFTADYQKLYDEIIKEIKLRVDNGISNEELDIIKKNYIGGIYSAIDKPGELAMEISTLTLIGDYMLDDYLNNLNDISIDELNNFIPVILPVNNTSIVVVSPFQDI